MNAKRKSLIERVASLPDELLDEVEQSLDEIVQFHEGAVYHPTPEEVAAIDEGLAQLDRGEIATDGSRGGFR